MTIPGSTLSHENVPSKFSSKNYTLVYPTHPVTPTKVVPLRLFFGVLTLQTSGFLLYGPSQVISTGAIKSTKDPGYTLSRTTLKIQDFSKTVYVHYSFYFVIWWKSAVSYRTKGIFGPLYLVKIHVNYCPFKPRNYNGPTGHYKRTVYIVFVQSATILSGTFVMTMGNIIVLERTDQTFLGGSVIKVLI